MPLIIPSSASFGDSTTTEGPLRRYVLAQFRQDSDMEWVRELRGLLARDDLKWTNLRDNRVKLRQRRELWNRIERGVGQSTIIVIDPRPIEQQVIEALEAEGLEADNPERDAIILDSCATEVVRGTPISYLPDSLMRAVGSELYFPLGSIEQFAPQAIQTRLGGSLRHAMIFAARAHALFDLERLDDSVARTSDIFNSPLSRVLLAELLSVQRNFDVEHKKSAEVLNDAAQLISVEMYVNLPFVGEISNEPLVREVDSRAIDHIQGADIAAGWAREVLETSDVRSLGNTFERVWHNGVRIK